MNSSLPQTAIDSLKDLESYYQSRYEYYLAKATQASQNKERVELLMQDLLKNVDYVEHQSLIDEKERKFELPRLGQSNLSHLAESEIENSQPKTLTDKSVISNHASLSLEAENEDNFEPSQLLKIKELLIDLSQVMEAIKSACRLDNGKSLHKSYLHKILNRQLSRELSVEMVDLYLDEAINRGIIETDEFDNQCYVAQLDSSINFTDLAQSNGHSEELQHRILQTGTKNTEQIQTKHRNLPPSPNLKLTLLETVRQYIAESNPKRFSAEDVINYLYSIEQQTSWSRNNTRKIRVSIFNVLSRKAYLNKYWKRVKPGIYRPLYKKKKNYVQLEDW